MAKRNWQATFEAPAPGTHPTARLAKIARLPLGGSEAELLWRDASRHRRELLRRLGRDVGQRVALLDYLTNTGVSRSQDIHGFTLNLHGAGE